MTAHRFVTDVLSGYTTILVTRPSLELSAEIYKQLLLHKHITVKKIFDPNSIEVVGDPAHVVIHFAGFEKESLAETLYHTSTLHKLMDICLRNRSQLVLVLPEDKSALKDTAIALVTQFGRNFNLRYRIIAVPVFGDKEIVAEEIVRTFVKNHKNFKKEIVEEKIVEKTVVAQPIPVKENPKKANNIDFHWRKLAILPAVIISVLIVVWLIFLLQAASVVAAANCSISGIKSGNLSQAIFCGKYTRGMSKSLLAQLNFAPFLKPPLVYSLAETQMLLQTSMIMGDTAVKSTEFGSHALAVADSIITSAQLPKVVVSTQQLLDQLAYLQSQLQQTYGMAHDLLAVSSWQESASAAKSLVGNYQLLNQEISKILFADNFKILILLQDNNELRGSGGFLANFAIVDLEEGKIKNVDVYATSETDKLLRGQIEPPADFIAATGENNWYLRDSNWGADFAISSERIAWFVGKELNQEADLVVATNWQFINALLSLTGQVDTTRGQVSAANLDEKIVALSTPEGIDKQFIETLLSTAIEKWPEFTKNKKQSFLLDLLKQLESRHMLVSSVSGANSAWTTVGWTGEFDLEKCDTSCVQDLFYAVDSNVGVNKVNSKVDVTRSMQIQLNSKEIKNTSKLIYTNNSRSVAWPEGDYKNYLRIYIPANAKIESLKIGGLVTTDYRLAIQGERQEIGILVNVPTSSSVSVELVTTQEVAKQAQLSYRLLYPNQPGARPSALDLTLNVSKEWEIILPPANFVASGQILRYNSPLDEPLMVRAELQAK